MCQYECFVTLSVLDLRKVLKEMGEEVDERQLRDLIAEVDINKNNTIEQEEFLQLMSGIKTGVIANNRMAAIMERMGEHKKDIPVNRSGGGV